MGGTLEPGENFAGYQILRKLGAGGMGAVYQARDRDLPRFVALKLLTLPGGEREHRARFQREADTVARLQHPNIVTVYARGEDDDRLWISMTFVDGSDVARALREGPMHPARAVRIIAETAAALDHAHDTGILHRDVKPANILLAEGRPERAVLTDFGIAKSLDESRQLTQNGEILASFQYAAPERLTRPEEADRRADVYSLGCTLFHMLTGEAPYPGQNVGQIIYGHAYEPVPMPSDRNPTLPRGFDELIARAMAKDPERRFDTCTHLAWAASRILRQPGTHRTAPAGTVHVSGPRSGAGQPERNATTMPPAPLPIPIRPGHGPATTRPGPEPTRLNSGPGAARGNSGPAPARLNSGPAPTRLNTGPAPGRANAGPDQARLNEGPAPTRVDTGPAPINPNTGPAPARANSGPGPANSGFAPTRPQTGPAPTRLVTGPPPRRETTGPAPGSSSTGPAPTRFVTGPTPSDLSGPHEVPGTRTGFDLGTGTGTGASVPGKRRGPGRILLALALVVTVAVLGYLLVRAGDGHSGPSNAAASNPPTITATTTGAVTTEPTTTTTEVPQVTTTPYTQPTTAAPYTPPPVTSQQPKTVPVPDVVGSAIAQAKARLENAGFVVEQAQREDKSAKGTVLETSPAAGTAKPVGSTVKVTVSSGPPTTTTITVPTLIGLSPAAVTSALQALGWHGSIAKSTGPTKDSTKDGKVIAQNPAAGTSVTADQAITITVGAYTITSSSPVSSTAPPAG
ncbi:protein kinase domain-containing protein [Nocardia sp. CA-136227]|uniref:protein kinase domain-containing protein n=1 Tax=Nocardia sp. CA-136227 TaxID=3239979 RepID=UPI003D99CA10